MPDLVFDLATPGKPLRRGHLRMGGANPRGDRIAVTSHYLEWNGRPWLPVMGEFQYSRHPCRFWEEELRKIRAGGVEIVPTYVLWSHHEEDEGVFDWSGDRDLRRFVELCQLVGLWVVVRMGPFCHGEARNGGLPDWLYGYPFEARSNDPRYLRYAQRLYQQIGAQLRGLTFAEGGPIIGIQCDNEYNDSAAPWETTFVQATEYTPKGAGGDGHLLTLKSYAAEAGLSVPLYTATGWGAATPILPGEFLPMYGGYAFYAWLDDPATQGPCGFLNFQDQHGRSHPRFDPASVPFACCELGGGMQPFYRNRPHVPAESVEAMHVVQLGSGSNLMGYYVYHGGTNPTGKHGFLNEHRCPRKSYDFQAPIREFGQLGENYHRLRRQFLFLRAWGAELAPMETVLDSCGPVQPEDVTRVRAAVRARDGRGFVFVSNYQDHVEMRDHPGVRFRAGPVAIPAWGTATVVKDMAAILPFGLDLAGIRLVSATVASLTRLEVDGEEHVFSYAVPGFAPGYVLDQATVAKLSGGEAVERRDGAIQLRVRAGIDQQVRLIGADGRVVVLWTLSDAESLACWQLDLWGRERIVLCRDGLHVDQAGLVLSALGATSSELAVFPPPAAAPRAANGTLEALPGGAFARYRWRAERTAPACTVERIAPERVLVTVPAGALDGLGDLFVQIDAVGDVAAAYVGGQLVHDWFLDGRPWWIGLKRFIEPGRPLELFLRVTAPRQENHVVYSQMAAMEVKEGGGPRPEIRAVEFVAGQRTVLSA